MTMQQFVARGVEVSDGQASAYDLSFYYDRLKGGRQ